MATGEPAGAIGTVVDTADDTDRLAGGGGESQLTARLCQRQPVPLWRVAARLGDSRGDRALSVLEELTAAGKLATFRAGLTEYYASPRVALTGRGPGLGTVIADSVAGLVLRNRHRWARRLR